jgi:hypothetical protein
MARIEYTTSEQYSRCQSEYCSLPDWIVLTATKKNAQNLELSFFVRIFAANSKYN